MNAPISYRKWIAVMGALVAILGTSASLAFDSPESKQRLGTGPPVGSQLIRPPVGSGATRPYGGGGATRPTNGSELGPPPGKILLGWVELRPGGTGFRNGSLRVYIERVPNARGGLYDGKAPRVSQVVTYNQEYGGQTIKYLPFAIGPISPRQGISYVIRALVDLNGDEEKSPGEYFSDQLAVFTGNDPETLIIPTDFKAN